MNVMTCPLLSSRDATCQEWIRGRFEVVNKSEPPLYMRYNYAKKNVPSPAGGNYCVVLCCTTCFAHTCRLDNALVLANEFDSAVKTELRILKDFEDTLRELGPIADDLETISDQLNEHKVCDVITHLCEIRKSLFLLPYSLSWFV